MKQHIVLSWLIVVITTVVLSGCAGAASSGESVYEFDFNVQAPPTHKFNTDVVEPWVEMVEEETDGKVKINVYTSGALGSLNTAYDDIKNGVYDIGYVVPNTESETGLFPLTIGELPFALSDPHNQYNVMSQFNEKYMSDVYEEATFMSVSSTDSYQLISKEPVKSIEDVKNKKINAIGDKLVQITESWDAIPVSLEVGQMYQALEKGTVDQVLYPTIGSVGFKLNEVAPHLTQVDATAMTLVYLMNTESLNSLPEELQKVFEEKLNPELAKLAADMYADQQEELLKQFEKEGGKVTSLEEHGHEEFKKGSQAIWQDWVEEANEKGYEGNKMMEDFKRLLKEEGLEVPF